MSAGVPFQHLRPGARYVVRVAFRDYDGETHPEGESWVFRTHSFLPYEDGLSLFVSRPDGSERQIRLQWRPEAQAGIIDALDRHIAPVEA
jgi:hypothetical protein